MLALGLVGLVVGAAATAPETPFAPLAFVAGQCWRATQADGGSTDTHCFEALYPPHFLRDRHVVCAGGKRVYAGETTYSRAPGGEIVWRYLSSAGLTIDGKLQRADTLLRFDGSYAAADGVHGVRATWTALENGYRAVTETRPPGGSWVRQSETVFTRADGPATCAQ